MSHHVVIKYDREKIKKLVANIKKMRLNKEGKEKK